MASSSRDEREADSGRPIPDTSSSSEQNDANATICFVPFALPIHPAVSSSATPSPAASDPPAPPVYEHPFPSQAPADYAGTADSSLTMGYDGTDEVPPNPIVRPPKPELETLAGIVVPGYDILQELGRGGMGVVYKARDRRLDRMVALKMVLAGTHAGAIGLARFRAEGAAAAQLHHPNIVQIYETGEHEGRPYFSLEYVSGGSLEERLREGPISPETAAKVVETLSVTMNVAHQRGIIHRDLKPGNVLLAVAENISSLSQGSRPATVSGSSLILNDWSKTTIPKIADFGLAKRLDEDSSQTQSGAILGTPCYMAPEQAKGETHAIGPAADIYSLGAILYELLVGRPPFKASSPIDTIRQVIEQEPIPPRQLEPRVPHDLETICLKCLQKESVRRYPTALELAEDLRRFLNNEPILARPVPTWERAWKWARRRPSVVALFGVCLAAVFGFVGLIVWFNLSLTQERDEARAEERQARQREQTAIEGQRLDRVRSEGQKLFDAARVAATALDWETARLHLSKVLTLVGNELGLADLRTPAQSLLAQVEQELRSTQERKESQVRFQKFGKLRDDAQFLGALYTGMDLAANLKATRTTVERALAVYGVAPTGDGRPVDDPYLSTITKQDIRDDCYLLMMILAETQIQTAGVMSGDAATAGVRDAITLLDSGLRFGPQSRAWHLRRARYLRKFDDVTGAKQAEQAATAATAEGVFDHFLLADELYRREDFDGAIREFNTVLRTKPGHFWSQYLNALCLLRQHRPAEARAQLTACLAQRADFVWLYLLRGFAQGELNENDAADADYRTALGLTLDDYSRYVLFVNRGVLRIRQERVPEAIADLAEAIRLRPADYQAYVNLAQAYRRSGQTEKAMAQLDTAIQFEPGMAHLYRLRGRLYLELKQPEKALADLDQAVARDSTQSPFRVDDQVERGRLLLLRGKPTDALAAFNAALRTQPTHSLAQRMRAEALFQLGKFEDVVAAFDQYLRSGPPLESVYRGRGLARMKLGQNPGAIEDFTKAVELKPSSEVFVHRGFAHLACEAPKLAQRDFEMALELEPNNPNGYLGRGAVAVMAQRKSDAARDAERAVEADSRSPRVLFAAARIHAACGTLDNDTRAIELIRDALTALPESERADFVSKYIRPEPALEGLQIQPRFTAMLQKLVPKR